MAEKKSNISLIIICSLFHSRDLTVQSLQIFAGAFPENYEPPSGFYFEVNDDSNIVQVTF